MCLACRFLKSGAQSLVKGLNVSSCKGQSHLERIIIHFPLQLILAPSSGLNSSIISYQREKKYLMYMLITAKM